MDLYYKQEITVGVLVLVAVVMFFFGLSWLTGRSIRRGQIEVPVHFTTVSGLTVGDPVQVSGVHVGRVADLALETVGRVLVRIEVEERVRPRVDAKASIKSLDFLGAKFVDYEPGSASRLLAEGEAISGVSGSDIAETTSKLTDNVAEVMLGAQRLLTDQLANDVHQTLLATQRALRVVERVGEDETMASAQGALRALERAATRLDSTIANPAISESISQLDELTENVTEMTEGLANATSALSTLLTQLGDTTGTLGRLVNSPTMHDEVREVLVSLRRLLDDVRERPGRYVNVSVF